MTFREEIYDAGQTAVDAGWRLPVLDLQDGEPVEVPAHPPFVALPDRPPDEGVEGPGVDDGRGLDSSCEPTKALPRVWAPQSTRRQVLARVVAGLALATAATAAVSGVLNAEPRRAAPDNVAEPPPRRAHAAAGAGGHALTDLSRRDGRRRRGRRAAAPLPRGSHQRSARRRVEVNETPRRRAAKPAAGAGRAVLREPSVGAVRAPRSPIEREFGVLP